MMYQLKRGFYEEIQKNKVGFLNRNRQQNTRKKMKSQHGRQLLRKRVKKELRKKCNKTTTMKKLRFLGGAHANESQ